MFHSLAEFSWHSVIKCLPHLTSICADTGKSNPMHSLHMETDHKRPTKTFQHTDTCYIKCACGYFWSELFFLVWPIPALQCHSIKASSCVYLYYSPTHAFTLIIFSFSFSNVALSCSYLVEAANYEVLWSTAQPMFGCVTAKEAVECQNYPKWIPHVVLIISFPKVDQQYNWKQSSKWCM